MRKKLVDLFQITDLKKRKAVQESSGTFVKEAYFYDGGQSNDVTIYSVNTLYRGELRVGITLDVPDSYDYDEQTDYAKKEISERLARYIYSDVREWMQKTLDEIYEDSNAPEFSWQQRDWIKSKIAELDSLTRPTNDTK